MLPRFVTTGLETTRQAFTINQPAAPVGRKGEAMSRNRDDATLRVYAALEEYERALDNAATRGALLAAELPQARLDGNFALEVAQGAFTHIYSSLSTIVAARGQVVEGHRELARVQRKFNLPVVSTGDKVPGPSPAIEDDELTRRVA